MMELMLSGFEVSPITAAVPVMTGSHEGWAPRGL